MDEQTLIYSTDAALNKVNNGEYHVDVINDPYAIAFRGIQVIVIEDILVEERKRKAVSDNAEEDEMVEISEIRHVRERNALTLRQR